MAKLRVEAGVRRSQRLMKKARTDPSVVIDLDDDEIEEDGDPFETAENPISLGPVVERNLDMIAEPPERVGNADISHFTGIDLDDSEVLGASMDYDNMEVSFGLEKADFVDLSSNESGDEGDGDVNGEIAEEQEEIITTLSDGDKVVFAEVVKTMKEGGDLRMFKLDQLKTYLRHHGLRMVGVKFTLLSRILEHQRIKDRAEVLYPRSSFSINCKGDVCLGDSVLFLQTVYNMPFDYDIRCASGPPLGKRWVAGKVVSESYGSEKQQHTFTIEVLWSTGIQPFYCMRPVRIKGRNLYRMVTMRQPWSNEAHRKNVLDEKHERGAAARAVRRGVKGLKSKGKSRADSTLHPYKRPREAEPHGVPPTRRRQDSGFPNPHQDSGLAAFLHSSMQNMRFTDRTIDQTVTATDLPAPPPTSGRRSHIQQSEAQGNIRRILAPPNPAHFIPAGRQNGGPPHFLLRECQFNGNSAQFFLPSMEQGGHSHSQHRERQVNGNPAHNQPPPMRHGRSHYSQQEDRHSNRNPARHQRPPRAHAQECGRGHTQHSQNVSNQAVHRKESACIPCSNSQCGNAGSAKCIMWSCAHCCTRNTKIGRCARHK